MNNPERVRELSPTKKMPECFEKNTDLIVVDCEFNDIMTEDVKVLIAKAFISLEAGMRHGKLWKEFSEAEIELVEKKASQMKQEINDFIDSQKQRIIDASEAR